MTEQPKRNLTIRFSEEEHAWLQAKAKEEHRSVGNLVRWIVEQWRESQGASNGPFPEERARQTT